jgi:tetratricopeptide (TPR) repeat protein
MVAFSAICTLPQTVSAGDWLTVRTANFSVSGDVNQTELRSAAVGLERFRGAFSALFPQLKTSGRAETHVLLFADSASYGRYKPRRKDGQLDDVVAGYFVAGEDANYIALAIGGGKAKPSHTLYHEFIHSVLKANFDDELPAWLNEGLCQYFETMRHENGRVWLGEPPEGRQALLSGSKWLSPEHLTNATRDKVMQSSDDERTLFYAQSWAVVHLLMSRGQGTPAEKLNAIFALTKSGDPAAGLRELVGNAVGNDVEKLRAYVAQRPMPLLELAAGEPVTPPVLEPARMSTADRDAALAELLYLTGQTGEAEEHALHALAADRQHLRANAVAGLSNIKQERFSDAAPRLEIAASNAKASANVLIAYAYSLLRMNGSGGEISSIPPATAAKMERALDRAVAVNPRATEAYRLMAFVHYVDNRDLPQAIGLLRKALEIRPADEDLQILLAQVFLRQEKYVDARATAMSLGSSANARIRRDADEILKVTEQYVAASLRVTANVAGSSSWNVPLVFLDHAWLTQRDLEQIELDRDISNLNKMLERPRVDEERLVGSIENIQCSNGEIRYVIATNDGRTLMRGRRFQDVRMAVLTYGESSFRLDCGEDLSDHPAVVAYKTGPLGTASELTSVTFVPKHFRLLSPNELASSRFVVVEGGGSKRSEHHADTVPVERRSAAIASALRPVQSGERRVEGTLDAIECHGDKTVAKISADGKVLRLVADVSKVKPTWFTAASSQIALTCGSTSLNGYGLFTFTERQALNSDGDLVAIEFLPAGLPLTRKLDNASR